MRIWSIAYQKRFKLQQDPYFVVQWLPRAHLVETVLFLPHGPPSMHNHVNTTQDATLHVALRAISSTHSIAVGFVRVKHETEIWNNQLRGSRAALFQPFSRALRLSNGRNGAWFDTRTSSGGERGVQSGPWPRLVQLKMLIFFF